MLYVEIPDSLSVWLRRSCKPIAAEMIHVVTVAPAELTWMGLLCIQFNSMAFELITKKVAMPALAEEEDASENDGSMIQSKNHACAMDPCPGLAKTFFKRLVTCVERLDHFAQCAESSRMLSVAGPSQLCSRWADSESVNSLKRR
jgi:hypothetical protein